MKRFFINANTICIISIMICSTEYTKAVSPLHHLFGSQEASAWIQSVNEKATKETGFSTPVLQMNAFSKQLGYSSFNWFNTTWINEETVDSRHSKKRLLWQLLHEKYHTLAHHDVRRLLLAGYLVLPLISDVPNFYIAPFSIIGHTLCRLVLFLWHEEVCENAADEYADRMVS